MKTNETRRVFKKDKSLGERGEMAVEKKIPQKPGKIMHYIKKLKKK